MAVASLAGQIVGLFADVSGVVQTLPLILLILAGVGFLVAVALWIGRRRAWFPVGGKLVLVLAGFSVVLAIYAGHGVIADQRAADREAMAATCSATRDYIDAMAAYSTTVTAAGGLDDHGQALDTHKWNKLADLTAAANRSGSGQAQGLVREVSQEKAASRGFVGKDDRRVMQHDIAAGKALRQLRELCQESGHEVSGDLKMSIAATAREACTSFHQFDKLAPLTGQQTDLQHEKASSAFSTFTYHAEFSGDQQLRTAERNLYEAFGNSDTERLRRGEIADLCAARGFPPG